MNFPARFAEAQLVEQHQVAGVAGRPGRVSLHFDLIRLNRHPLSQLRGLGGFFLFGAAGGDLDLLVHARELGILQALADMEVAAPGHR